VIDPYAMLGVARQADGGIYLHAGPEIGVASTKAFTAQLVAVTLLALKLGLARNLVDPGLVRQVVKALWELPDLLSVVLGQSDAIRRVAERFVDHDRFLYLGRGLNFPLALEGALKLKEISYIHAEAYAAAELKHGPLALVDEDMPVVAVAPNNDLLEKLKSNLQEVRARGGKLVVFADPDTGMESSEGVTVIHMPVNVTALQAPVIFAVPMQLLAYHVAVLKGTDVDQPRNLAKSLTVE